MKANDRKRYFLSVNIYFLGAKLGYDGKATHSCSQ